MRKLGLISSLWAALLFFPLTGFALGLGEIEASSFLNQPLKAEIEVISARPGEIDDLLISLASRDAFAKAGLDRPAGLSKLRFKVEKSEDGQSARILVSTKTPVREPFLSFLVEADWAKGRLLREFTVLLDPLSFAQQSVTVTPQVSPEKIPPVETESVATTAPAEAQPVDSQVNEAVAQPIAIPADSPSSEQQVPFVADSEYLSSAEQLVVTKGDTLWGLSAQFKDDDHSMAQVMLAMQAVNPQAFGRDNINNLKVGSVLRVPDMDVMDRLSKQEAYAQVLEQNGLWDEYVARKSGAPSPAVAGSSSGLESTQQQPESQLNLLTADEGDSDSASLQNDATSSNAGQIRKQLALAEEELEAAKLENDDLKSRIENLEEQLSKFEELKKLVEIEDSSLASLQESAAEEESMSEDIMEKPEPAVATDEEMTVIQEEQVEQEKPSDVMIEAAGEMLSEEAEPTEPDSMAAMEPQSTEAETLIETTPEKSDGMSTEESMDQQEEVTVPAPVIVTQAPEAADGGVMDMLPSVEKLLSDPIMLGGIGAIIALLLGFIFLRRKKSDTAEEGITIEEPEGLLDDDATPIHVPTTTQVSTDEDDDLVETAIMDKDQDLVETLVTEAEDDDADEFAATAIISSEDLVGDEATESIEAQESIKEEQDDVLNEVDVYLAYGLYDNAEDLLNESLQNNPERADYRAKLLDTYFATKNAAAFVKEAEVLKSLGGAADRFWDRIQIMGFELAPDVELFSGAKDSDVSVVDLEYAKPETADFDIGSDDEVTDFSDTDFDLGDDSFDVSATQVMDKPEDDFSETQDLDSLDLDFGLDEAAAPELESEALTEEVELPDDIAAEIPESVDELDEDFDLGDELEGLDAVGGDAEPEVDLEISEEVEPEPETDAESEAELDRDLDLDESEDDLNFDLPEDMDLSDEDDSATEIIELEPTVEAPASLEDIPPMDEDGIELDLSDSDDVEAEVDDSEGTSETLVISPEELAAQTEQPEEEPVEQKLEAEIALDDELDLDMGHMEDASLETGEFSPSDTVALTGINLNEDDITEFRPADVTGEFEAFVAEATDEVSSVDEASIEEPAIDEVDAEAGLDKTGTFAPGDFNEDEVAESITEIDDIDDIGDLMLPDDVDEVSTKLDLAKAFIDMGDAEGARSSLDEVLSEGTVEQKAEATSLMEQIK